MNPRWKPCSTRPVFPSCCTSNPSGVPPMLKITGVQAHLLSYPFEAPITLSYHGGERTIMKRDAMLIRVETDGGIIGYAPGQGSERAKQVIDTLVAPFLTGRNLGDPDALRVLFVKSAGDDEYAAKTYCSVEIALMD